MKDALRLPTLQAKAKAEEISVYLLSSLALIRTG
jgi:hypothetical protein